ncbi:MAG: MFS transporter [Stellaceae bacterium]
MRARTVPATLSSRARGARPAGPFSTADHVAVSILWLALYAQWLTVVPTIVPDQVASILGPYSAFREGISGSIIAAGAAVALVVTPVAGALSDRLQAAHGRRRPFLVSGIVAASIALALLVPFGSGSNLLLYALAILNLQFWWNWAAGPYAGLIPDVVPAAAQSTASGWMNVMSIFGTILGNALVAALYRPGRVLPVIVAFIALNLACLALTLRGVREPAGAGRPFDRRGFVRSFYLEPRAHQNFYWVLLTRLLANMGIWSVFTFLLFYLESVVGIARITAAQLLPGLLGMGAVLAIPASLVGTRLSDRYGIVRLVRITNWIMAAAALCYVLIAWHPRLTLVAPVVLAFSAAYGAYGAVDWALALKVLPSGQNSGKDMGIWHIAMVLPQMLGPAATGWLITAVKTAASERLAYAVAFALAALWFTLAALLVGHVRLALPAEVPGDAA